MITGLAPSIGGALSPFKVNFAGGSAAVAANFAAQAQAASVVAQTAAASVANAALVPALVNAPMSILAPCFLVVGTPGISLTLGSPAAWAVKGVVVVKDMTGAANPNIFIDAMVDGIQGFMLEIARQGVRLDWSIDFETWLST